MDEQRKFDFNKVGVQEIHFSQFSHITREGLAGTIKRELEGRLKIQTVGLHEWEKALTLANPLCVMDHALGRFDIGPDSNFAEQLANERGLILPADAAVRSCRHCGCTDDDCSQCIQRTGGPCYWVSADECSACREEVANG
jgi:hypothetical protein